VVEEENRPQSQEEEGGNCVVCRILNYERYFVPCGHPVCHTCGEIIMAGTVTIKRCPYCRAVLTSLLTPFGGLI